jgi:hypothetical protein
MAAQSPRPLLCRAIAAGAVALAVAACGGGPTGTQGDQRAAIRRTIVTFMRELAAGNGMVACEGLTVGGASSLAAAIGPELGNFDISGCVQVVDVSGSELTPQLRTALASVTVGAVRLSGSNATVRWSAVTSPAGDVAAYFGRARWISLVWVKSFWYIDGF